MNAYETIIIIIINQPRGPDTVKGQQLYCSYSRLLFKCHRSVPCSSRESILFFFFSTSYDVYATYTLFIHFSPTLRVQGFTYVIIIIIHRHICDVLYSTQSLELRALELHTRLLYNIILQVLECLDQFHLILSLV